MIRRRALSFIVPALLAAGTSVPAGAAGTAKYVGAFLDRPGGARIAALGGASAALADDSFSFYANPAGLGYAVDNPELSYMLRPGPAESSFNYYGALWAPFNLSLVTFDAGELEVLEFGEDPRRLRAQRDTAVSLGWGRALTETLFAGVNGTYVASTLAETYSAAAFSADAGMLVRTLDDVFSFGAVGRNLFRSQFRYYRRDESLPSDVVLGASLRLPLFEGNRVLLSGDYSLGGSFGRYGIELIFYELVAARAGLSESGGNRQLNVGLGINSRGSPRVSFDYGLDLFMADTLQSGHTLSLSLRFGGVAPADKAEAYGRRGMKKRAALWRRIAEQTKVALPATYTEAASSVHSPVAAYVFPDRGPAGSPVKIAGAKYDPRRTSVFFGRKKADILSIAGDAIMTRVPAGTAPGRVRVIIETPGGGPSNTLAFVVEASTPPFLKVHDVSFEDAGGDGVLEAGESGVLRFSVADLLDSGEAYGVKAIISAGRFDRHLSFERTAELGDLRPGMSRQREVLVRSSGSLPPGDITFQVDIEEINGTAAGQATLNVRVVGKKR